MRPSRTSSRALDLPNLFSADVHAGIGPFPDRYLQATRNWDPESIGLALFAAGFGAIRRRRRSDGWLTGCTRSED
jgi:hypothetical protein